MAYDAELTDNFRNCLEGIQGISEKRMMGGVCFLHDGNMIGGADRPKNGSGRYMFRIGKDQEKEAQSRPEARIMEMGGRKMGGMYFVEASDCDNRMLNDWISLCMSFVVTLPSKIK